MTDSRSFHLQRYDLFVQPEIVGLFGGKAAIDLQAFLRMPLRDGQLCHRLTIGDAPRGLHGHRASCPGWLTGTMLHHRERTLALLRALGLGGDLRVSHRRSVTDSHSSFRESLDLFVQSEIVGL